jgi:hypothetical protein
MCCFVSCSMKRVVSGRGIDLEMVQTALTAAPSPEDTRPAVAATSSAATATHAVRSMDSGLSCSLHTVEAAELPAIVQCCRSCWGDQQQASGAHQAQEKLSKVHVMRHIQLALARLLTLFNQQCWHFLAAHVSVYQDPRSSLVRRGDLVPPMPVWGGDLLPSSMGR